jgi:two-component system NtrC family sensor kinase
LTTKLGIASALSVMAVLGAYGTERLNRQLVLFESDMRRDHETFGRALAIAAEIVAVRHGAPEAQQLIDLGNRRETRINIQYHPGRAPTARSARPSVSSVLLGSSLPPVISYVPLEVSGAGYLSITESRGAQAHYMRGTLLRVASQIVLVVILIIVSNWLLGWWILGRGLRRLVGKVRSIGEGRLDEPLMIARADEIGLLARELNAMCDKLRAAQARVDDEVQAKLRALEHLRHSEKLNLVGKLASGMAHELGTPLNVVQSYAHMIASGESEGALAAQNARVVVDYSERMTRTIRQVLDFSRRSHGKRQLHDVAAVARASLDVLAPILARANVRGQLGEDAGGPHRAWVDADQLTQVMSNLLMNAVQASPAGGDIEVHVRTVDAAHIDPPLPQLRARYVAISVTDHGTGMSAEVRERALEPFFTTKEAGQGTGLGLSVVQGIVEEHDGSLRIDSSEGAGTTVHVYLPVDARHD